MPAGPGPEPVQVPPNCDLTLGVVCLDKSERERTVWRMEADERFANPAGLVQGGFLAAFADSAMGATCVRFARGERVVAANAELKVSLVRPVPAGSRLTCTATVVSGGRRVVFLEAEIADEEGRLVAKASSTFLLTARE
ncbi:MAG TPA: PaaI family thioesterase [Acidimicrobiales bacterium]|nr:PaaI family thioesterase [Acidimicrobiales bacterium]